MRKGPACELTHPNVAELYKILSLHSTFEIHRVIGDITDSEQSAPDFCTPKFYLKHTLILPILSCLGTQYLVLTQNTVSWRYF